MSWYDKRSNSTGALTTRLAVDASEVKGVCIFQNRSVTTTFKILTFINLVMLLLASMLINKGIVCFGSVTEQVTLLFFQATGLRLGTVLQTIAGIITALVIAFEAAWLLTLVLFACFPLLVGVGYLQIRLLKGRSIRNKELTAESGKTANEAIDNIRTVASLGIETKFYDIYNEQLKPPFKLVMI